MKIFISHSSKDAKIATELARLFERMNPEINVFCSSETGAIQVGQNFVKVITDKLTGCNAFIPLLSDNYYSSRFCVIELGFAYAVLTQKADKGNADSYIFPVAIPPVTQVKALNGTPLSHLQVSYIHEARGVRELLEAVLPTLPAGMNEIIGNFADEVKKSLVGKLDINSLAQRLACKAANVPGEDSDYISYSENPASKEAEIIFNAKPFGSDKEYPEVLSFVYNFVDKIDLYQPAMFFESSYLKACLNNETNSITKINVEIKYSDSKEILLKKAFELGTGENQVLIPLREIRSEAAKQVSEICFVITPSAYRKTEGRLRICGLEICLEAQK